MNWINGRLAGDSFALPAEDRLGCDFNHERHEGDDGARAPRSQTEV